MMFKSMSLDKIKGVKMDGKRLKNWIQVYFDINVRQEKEPLKQRVIATTQKDHSVRPACGGGGI
jgi:hypothetical protein